MKGLLLMRHTQGIDVLRLISKGSASGWNEMLNQCYEKNDINGLVNLHQRLSVGMTDLEKTKMNTDKINEIFLRMLRSLELTALKIGKKINPNPLDRITPDKKALIPIEEMKKMKAHKNRRTQEILGHFRKEAF